MTHGTFAVFEILGLDLEDLEWQDLAICKGQPLSKFYEEYESNPRTAKIIDEMCLSCPIRKECLSTGIENNEWGVWGAIYLTNGRVDEGKNAHKTPEVWDRIRSGIS